MFNLFRQSKQLTKLIFWVIILAMTAGMIFFFVPTPGDRFGLGRGSDDVIARVEGMTVPTKEYQLALRRYREQFTKYSQGGDLSFLKSLHIEQRALDELVQERVIAIEAHKLGLKATDEEVVDRIQKIPGLSQDGRFIGKEALLRGLQYNNMTFNELEQATRASILQEKLNKLLTDGISVSPEEVKQEWMNRNEKATIEYVLFDPKNLEKDVHVTDAELAEYFNKNKGRYKTGEERKVKLVFVEQNAVYKNIPVSEQEMRDYFQKNLANEEARVAHILLKTEGKSEQEVEEIRKKAEGVLKEIRAGADFGKLAEKYSEDDFSAKNKGELPPSTREGWVPEFSQVAFSLNPGQVSDLVKSQYGFHIIKLLEKKTPKFEDRKDQIETTLKLNKAQDEAKRVADKIENEWKQSKDLEKAAKANGFEVSESPYIKSNATTLPPLRGGVKPLVTKIFQLPKAGDMTSPPVKVPGGYAIAQLVDVKPSTVPELNTVKSKVEADYKKEKAEELSASQASEFAKTVEADKSLELAAKKFGLTVETSDAFTRSASIDKTIGYAPEVAEKAFSLKVGDASGVMNVQGGKKIVFRLKSHTEFDKEQFEKEKASLQDQLLGTKRSNFFHAYINSLMDKMKKEHKIVINQEAFRRYTL